LKPVMVITIVVLIMISAVNYIFAQDTINRQPNPLAIPVSITIEKAVLCTGIQNNHPLEKQSSFNINDERIYIWLQYRNLDTHTLIPLSAYWIKNKRPRSITTSWIHGSEGVCWFPLERFCYLNTPGKWHVEILANDTILLGMNFTVINVETDQITEGQEQISEDQEQNSEIEIIEKQSDESSIEQIISPSDSYSRIHVSAGSFNRGNLKKNHPLYSYLTVSSFEFPSWAEYDLTIPESGTYELWFNYSAAESRPTKIYFDGLHVVDKGLSEITGGWYADTLKWNHVADINISEGLHVLRIDNSGNIPCLKEFLLLLKTTHVE